MPGNNLLPFITAIESTPSLDQQLRDAFRSSDVEIPESFIFDREIHRFGPKKRCWYVLFDDGIPGGAWGDWSTDHGGTWRGDTGKTYTALEEMQFAQAMAESKKKAETARQIKNELAAETAQELWEEATPATSHDYLTRKGIKSHMARINGDGNLIVPMYVDGEISSIQTIFRDGTKLFLTGGKVKGASLQFGSVDEKVYLAEGFATAATIYEETGVCTIAAFSAHNLVDVCRQVREAHKSAEIVIVADNDKSGTGQNYATQASAKYGARVIIPPESGQDANDFKAAGGDLAGLLGDDTAISDKMQVIFGDELPEEYEAPDEVIQDLLVAGSMAVIYGDSNSGKTFFALSLATAVAEGRPVYGKKVDQGLVVYLATESPGSIRSRLQAIKKHLGVTLSSLAVVPIPLNFYSNAGDALDVVRLVKSFDRPVKIIFADTLARMSAGANENSGEDMGPVMERFSTVAAATGAAMVIIHHNGKDTAKGARGWSGIRAHIETEIEVIEENGERFATVTKQRELSSKGQVISFDLEIVEMGKSKFGEKVTTCVAVQGHSERLSKKDKTMDERVKIVEDAWYTGGMETLDGSPYFTRSVLRETMKEKGKTPAAITKAMEETDDRLIGSLIKNKVIESKNNGWIFTDPALSSKLMLIKSEPRQTGQTGHLG